MALGVGDIPLNARPGFMQGLMDVNEFRKGSIENRIKQIEAQYAPYTNYADAASKLAYSQFVGPQSIASILTSPQTRGMFTQDQYNQLAKAFSQQVQGPGNVLGALPLPSSSGSVFSNLINYLKGNENNVNPINNSSMQPAPNVFRQPSADSGYQYDINGNNVKATPQEINAAVGRSNGLGGTSPSYARLSSNLPPGTLGATSPPAVTAAGEAALKAQTEAEAKAITEQWQKRQDEIRDQSAASIEMENQLSRLEELRKELNTFEKGFGFGHLPGISSAAQESGLVENNLIAARLKAWLTVRITNMDLGFGKGMKPGRWLNDEAFKNEVNYERGLSKRLQEYSSFANTAQSIGISPSQADSIWIRYANERPFFDPSSKKVLDKNLETWEEYLTPDSIKQTFSPTYRKQMEKYKNNMYGADSKKDDKIMNEFNSNKNSGAKILSKKMIIPKFNSKYEFLNWYNKQEKIVQHAVRIQLGEK